MEIPDHLPLPPDHGGVCERWLQFVRKMALAHAFTNKGKTPDEVLDWAINKVSSSQRTKVVRAVQRVVGSERKARALVARVEADFADALIDEVRSAQAHGLPTDYKPLP